MARIDELQAKIYAVQILLTAQRKMLADSRYLLSLRFWANVALINAIAHVCGVKPGVSEQPCERLCVLIDRVRGDSLMGEFFVDVDERLRQESRKERGLA